jgi:hypothetical protein
MRQVRSRRRWAVSLARPATGAMLAAELSGAATELAQAQAYCGPGHGRRWPVEAGNGPSNVVQLETPGGPCSYGLLVHPRTLRPARDHQGRYSYLPLASGTVPSPLR